MRWFKHLTNANGDESLSRLVDEFGLEGYGAYWMVLEKIASQCGASGKTSLSLSVKNWRKCVPFAAQKLAKWLAFANQMGLFCVEISENIITVDCPKLLKIRDEYADRKAKKSGECRENVGVDQIQNREEYINPDLKFSQGANSSPGDTPPNEGEPQQPQSQQQPTDQPKARGRKPKAQHSDGRPEPCPREQWDKYLSFSRRFHEERATALGSMAPFSEGKVLDGAKAMDNLIRVKGVPKDELVASIVWATEDDFWSKQIRSLSALTNKSRNGDTKYSNLRAAYQMHLERPKREPAGVSHARQ